MKKKIIIPLFSFGKAGGERVISQIANGLNSSDEFDVLFVVPSKNSDPYYKVSANVIKVKSEEKFCKLINFLVNCFNLVSQVKKLKPDYVIATYHMTAYLVFLLPSNIKKYYYIQAYEVELVKGFIRKSIAKLTYYLPLNKIVNSDKLLPGKINNYVSVIPAGINNKVFYRKNDITKVRSIGLVGRKEKYKGTDELIDIICECNLNGIMLNVAIYLSEENRRKLNQNKVRFNFFKIDNDNELADFYRKNDLQLAIGLIEDGAFHYPCAEGMCCSNLVISNYSPLYDTNSKLKIAKFDSDKIKAMINNAILFDAEQIKEETRIYEKEILKYYLSIINDKFIKEFE